MSTAMTGLEMTTLIRQLARVHDDGQLEALTLDYSADCRGLAADSAQLHTASELFRVRMVVRALSTLFALAPAEAEPMVRSVLLRHPRRESALALVNEYARDAEAFDKLAHERAQERARSRTA